MTDLDQLIRGVVRGAAGGARPALRRRPQVSLLPAEIRGAAHGRRVRVLAAGAVVVALVAAGGATALAASDATAAEARQAQSAAQLAAVAAQTAKFADVQRLQQGIALGEAAERVGASTAIDWQRWRGLIVADMPSAFTITSFKTDSATPFADYPQGTTPIEKARAATVTITATAASLDSLPVWVRMLKALPALSDLQVPDSSKDTTGYTVTLVLHLTTAAYTTPLKGAAP